MEMVSHLYQIGVKRTDLNVTVYTPMIYLGGMSWRFSKDHLEEQWKIQVDRINLESTTIQYTSWWLGTKENYDQKYVKVLFSTSLSEGSSSEGVLETDLYGGDFGIDNPLNNTNSASLISSKLDEFGILDIDIVIDGSDPANFDAYLQFNDDDETGVEGTYRFDDIDPTIVHTFRIDFKLKPIVFTKKEYNYHYAANAPSDAEISEFSSTYGHRYDDRLGDGDRQDRLRSNSNKNEIWVKFYQLYNCLKNQLWNIGHSENTYNISQLNEYSVKFNEYIPSMLGMTGLKFNYEIDENVEGICPNALIVHQKRVRVREALTLVLLGFKPLCLGQKDMVRLISQYIWKTRFDDCWIEYTPSDLTNKKRK
jgi:hypothetical protein